jgi:hypothetical protein
MNWGGGGCKDSEGCLFPENVGVKDSETAVEKCVALVFVFPVRFI